MSRFSRWLAMTGVVVLSGTAVVALGLSIYAAWLFSTLPDANELAEYRPPTSTRVFAWDGTLIGEFSRERRIFAPYDEIPPRLRQAVLASEDRNFFQHAGVDVWGLGRAAMRAPGDVLAGRRVEGASTVTQQVARNILLGEERLGASRTLDRKLREFIIAARLEGVLSKEQILELYLNEIWLGYRSYGVAAAAYNYFGKSLDELTLGEMAYLAALPKGPDNYHPIRRRDAAIGRRNSILAQMRDLRWITPQEAQVAMAEPLAVQSGPSRAQYRDADYFVEQVRLDAIERLGQQVNEGGLYIRTTLDPQLQTWAREALQDGLERYDRRHGWRGAALNVPVADGWEARARTLRRPAERIRWRTAQVLGGSRVRLLDGREGSLDGGDAAWARNGRGGLREGDIVFVEPTEGSSGWRLKQVPDVNGSIVAIDPRNGRTLAMVGGYSFSLSNFNRATQAMRQPGSSFTPFVYAAALESGMTPASIVMDTPLSIGGWRPQNYSRGRFYGASTMRAGLTYSRNVMTVRIAMRVGMREVRNAAIRMGVANEFPNNLAVSLGAGEVTPFRLTGAYSAFANGGLRVEPHLIEVVQDRDGGTIFRADRRRCSTCDDAFNGQGSPRVRPLGVRVLHPVTAYQVTSFLQDVVRRGTAASAASLGHNIAGKTGTTDDYRSAWFVGYTPDIVVSVFIGRDDNRSLGSGEAGGVAALPMFIDFMRDYLPTATPQEWLPPEEATVHAVNGVQEAFREQTLNPTGRLLRASAPPAPQRAYRPSAARRPRDGPIPYSQAWPGGELNGGPPPAPTPDPAAPPPAPTPEEPPPPPRDLTGLY